ncbi:hypothetical protein [Burkholderia anthina]|uniref:hypothetical protein n=1 Tax=Burkholderia anthina TaxID=179879 RepID=UPI00158EA9F4|nr:hypothetical protein [Burkholderia anthina]
MTTEKDRSAGRGGAGRGQGRKAVDGAGPVERKTVTLDADSITTLRALGDGDLSVGIRRAAALIRSMKRAPRSN